MTTLFLLILIPASVFWDAFVLQKLWAWFIVPVFGIGAIELSQAIGLALLVAMLTHQRPSGREDAEDVINKAVAWALVVPLISLGVGWLAK